MVEKWIKLFTCALCASLMLGVAGCEDDDYGGGTPRDVSGTWSVQVQDEGAWVEVDQATFTQDGTTVSGTQQSGPTVSGSVSSNTLTLSVTTGSGAATLVASGDGDTLAGTLTEADGSQEPIRLVRI